MLEVLKNLWETSGFAQFFLDPDGWKSGIMILIAFALLYMAIKKQFEPLLLLPIAFGMLLTNLPWPGGGIFHPEWFEGDINWAALGGQYHDAAGNHITMLPATTSIRVFSTSCTSALRWISSPASSSWQ